jgi:molybdopterin molybdotransferase
LAQLSDDCFAFGGGLLSPEAALELIGVRVAPHAGVETVALAEADDRVLAADLLAPIDLPPFANAAVDGYAVRHADLADGGETVLAVRGRLMAGADRVEPLAPFTARRIFTGAPLPTGADTVFMQEDTRPAEDQRVVLPAGLRRGANTRAAGEDVPSGTTAIPAGTRLGPAHLALAAALGQNSLPVRQAVRVAVFSTGDELHQPPGVLPQGGIFDANRPLLMALARRAGAAVTDLGILRDAESGITREIAAAAAAHDLVLTSGGVSVGEEDHLRAAIAAEGSVVAWRLSIKPGRPVAMGVVRGTPLVGLPGNPVAAFLGFVLLVRPLLARLGAESFVPAQPLPVTAGFAYRKRAGRREYVRVRLEPGADGPIAQKHPQDGAGVLTSLTRTDGLVVLPEPVLTVSPGDRVGFLAYAGLI